LDRVWYAEHLIPQEKNKDNDGKQGQALSQREREFRLRCSALDSNVPDEIVECLPVHTGKR
jgi:hypothetical protein